MTVLGTAVDRHDEAFRKNREDMLGQLETLEEQLRLAGQGGTEKAVARHKAAGKLTLRERVAMLIDPDTPFLEIGALAGYYTDYPVGGGAIVGVGTINGTECVIFGNDPTVLGGALTQTSIPKIDRALQIAKQNRLPYVQLIESAGGDLRPRGSDIEEILKSSTFHFAGSGGFFYETTVLSGLGIPTVAIVFGSSTAGGAYMPGLSEYTILVKDQAKVFLGGPPLVKVATGEESTDEELGGAEMHASVSGLADYLAEDELDAIRQARDIVRHLHWRKEGPAPTGPADPPVLEAEDLLGLMSQDLRQPLDVREVIGRITDGSRFEEFKARYGTTLICGWADIHGYPVGILGNNGPLFPESSQKASQFIQLCNKTSTPLVFLQNITGYMVGKDYEQAGMVKWGSQMINALSNSAVPHVTIILGSSYGAGNYGMGGRGFGTRFVFLWPTAKVAVMGPQQIAGVMSIVRRAQAARRGEAVDEALEKMITDTVAEVQERQSLAMYASGRGVDDGVIDPRDTRTVIGLCLSACHSAAVEGAESFGAFR
ncbi:MAG: Acetyl-CoA carboxylase carboxyltransferase subunit [Frankiales bacterium]|jgi:acetyl-CoA carboxylase carboxyltransferase component|nr:Acetyl-CoA carboxylase carboxyltransferase subunit [Frankiales bacterium]